MPQRSPEIEAAQFALESLSSELTDDYKAYLQNALPQLARKMAHAGEAVDVDMFVEHARKGKGHLEDLKKKYNKPPQETIEAFSALKILGPELTKEQKTALKKSLPALARQMAQAGEDVSADMLVEQVRQGEDHLAVLKEKYTQKPKTEILTYERAINSLKPNLDLACPNFDGYAVQEKMSSSDDLRQIIHWLDNGFDARNVLRRACEFGQLFIVEFLIENRERYPFEKLSVAGAASNGYLEIVKYLQQNTEVDIHAENDLAFCVAVRNGHLDIAKYLLDQGADIHADNGRALTDTCGTGNLDAVKFLLRNGADVSMNKDSALIRALEKGFRSVADLLIKSGAGNVGDKSSFVFYAANNGLEKYVKRYADSCNNDQLANAADKAFRNHKIGAVKILLNKGASLKRRAYLYQSIEADLVLAAMDSNNIDMFRTLKQEGFKFKKIDALTKKNFLSKGNVEIFRFLRNEEADINLEEFFIHSLINGNFEAIQFCLDEGVDYKDFDYEYGGVSFKNKDALSVAAKYKQEEAILFFKKYDPNFYKDHLTNALKASGQYDLDGKIDTNLVYFLVNEGAEAEKIKSHIKYFVQNGDVELVKFLIDNGADIYINDNEALTVACRTGNLPMVKLLVEHGANELIPAKPRPEDMGIQWGENLQILDYLADHTSFDLKEHTSHEGILEYRLGLLENYRTWKRMFPDMEIGNKLGLYNPYHFSKDAYQAVLPMLKKEGYNEDAAGRYAYEASCLFKSEQRVLQYLEKWGEAGKQPLHDVILDIQIPRQGRPDLKAWGDAVLKHGPKMVKLVKFSDRLPQPVKDGSGGWSYSKTKEEIAKHAYKRGAENPRLASFCLEHAWDDDDFEDALKQIEKFKKKYKPSDLPEAANDNIKGGAIPDITIDGKDFDKDGYTFKKLPDGDVKGLLLGEFTNCCQHLASQGRDCAKHGFISDNGGFYVVEDKKTGDIVGQTWAWRGKKGEIVFDSLESLSGHFNAEKWNSLCNAFSEKIKTIAQDAGIISFHVGKGGATPKMNSLKAETPAKPIDYKGYRDSNDQYQIATF